MSFLFRRPTLWLTLTLIALGVIGVFVPHAPAGGNALLIDSYATEPGVVEAGGTCTFRIELENHTSRRVEDVQVTIGGEGGADSAQSGLVVVGTGNTKRVGRIAAESTETVTFDMAADPATEPGAHAVPVTIDYTVGGRPEQVAQSLGVMVTRLSRLEVTSFELPDEAKADEGFEVLAEVMNTGESRSSGVILTLTASGSGEPEIENGRQVVGALEPGDLDVVEAQVSAEKEGTVDVTLTVAYTDPLGAAHEETYSKSVRITAGEDENAASEDPTEGRGFFESIAAFFRSLFGLGS